MTLNELSAKVEASVYTVGKQLSLLEFKTKYNPLPKKGFSKPLVKKFKEAGVKTSYSLHPNLLG
ncbi:MAG: hypothetical protein CL943_00870 [Candidatus Diapherotrites archaeon]|uniref:Uncharacterized protein n=1 Tax=Candidatus Iainarchaeum sp. TaxID=3101447 RepID=A0A2D6M096_9ARCH|nr:hypothetical protein [Candidatus Diapherotrites archaeon]